ncbi:NAD(+) diphosphatase [Aestuariimicrobium sp. Y1814]|uniref:NAD(+) diphosphatase n=1 Tax=Aestuariimicrobium sp. Y1814 TaxID=3418742 RepID=UPI003DA7179C
MNRPEDLHSPLRRAGEDRVDPELLVSRFRDQSARVVVMDRSTAHRLESAAGKYDPARHIYLGHSGAADALAGDPGPHEWFAVRDTVVGPGLRETPVATEPLLRDLLTTTAAILAWHDTTPHCEACLGASQPARGGFIRVCLDCGAWLFPRHDPAIIIAILDPQDRLLLAHQASWAPNRVSIIAGFVEAGESLEQAAGREVGEEVGLHLGSAHYVTSQAWPFPRSLMLGMVGTAAGEPVPDGVEIQWARWFSREEFTAAVDSGEVIAPSGRSVASRLIKAWLDGTLPRHADLEPPSAEPSSEEPSSD